MSKEIIHIYGRDVLVREDTAKSYRGVVWILLTLSMIVLITTLLFFGGFIYSASDGELEMPKTRTGETVN